jgi:NDP-sugar pyrophosphorylase family protein
VRLRPLTVECPKPMLQVGERPLLERLLVLLRDAGIRQVAVNVHYRPEVIQRYFGDGTAWGVGIHYLREEQLLGSAGTLRQLREFFDGTFVVTFGDLYTNADVRALVAFHQAHRAALTMALHDAEEPTREGIVALDPQTRRVTRFVEKPASDAVFSRQANAGIFVMEPAVIEHIPADDRPLDIGHDLIPALLRANVPIFGAPLQGFVLDIGSRERYELANQLAAAGTPGRSGVQT